MIKLTAQLDEIASELEFINSRIALAIDQVSDRIEHCGAVKDKLEVTKEEAEKYPEVHHPFDVIEKIKKSIKNPEIEKKVEDYINEKHNSSGALKITEVSLFTGSKHPLIKDSIPISVEFNLGSGDGINKEFFIKNKIDTVYATGDRKYYASVYVPLSVFEI